ncbi:transketolase, N-terminal section [Rhodopseudomonas palustris]|uniref:transketolase n=1 Tax=Rhodopseudomonas palustris TaxID=1076 RepID=UPI000D1A036D|nr:transketolase [Rhodopseudomonas palustris]AVT78117.1 transketolase, N-terminal section [Rhodopseudomonas palustris]AVT78128.1 transketolase, N-terminal section [Rhodopseudomonas palustris]
MTTETRLRIGGNALAGLPARARWVWRETLALNLLAPETRLASSLSSIEIFVALYYGGVLAFDPKRPLAAERDRCVISKGHGSICMYPILADLGFFPVEELSRICQAGSFLGGIPDPVIPGYETVNGSLGHGLGVASGMALGLQRGGGAERSVFVVTGDGELHEGANWEAIMFAAQHGLDNLHLIVDDNRISMLGFTDDIVSHDDLAARLTAFGWSCARVDGHDVEAVRAALLAMKVVRDGRPKALLARTVKGRGVPGLENVALSHILTPKRELLDRLLETTA